MIFTAVLELNELNCPNVWEGIRQTEISIALGLFSVVGYGSFVCGAYVVPVYGRNVKGGDGRNVKGGDGVNFKGGDGRKVKGGVLFSFEWMFKIKIKQKLI